MTTLLEASPDVLPVMPTSIERITVIDFRHLEFDVTDSFYYELLNGELVAKSVPSPFNQRITGNISFAMCQAGF